MNILNFFSSMMYSPPEAAKDYQQLLNFLAEQGLAVAPVPEAMQRSVRRLGQHSFFVGMEKSGDYFRLHMKGHGINSYYLCYELRFGALEIQLRRPWGNVYGNKENDAQRIHETFGLLSSLLKNIEKINAMGQLHDTGKKLVIRDIQDEEDGWGWLDIHAQDDAELAQSCAKPLSQAAAAINAMASDDYDFGDR